MNRVTLQVVEGLEAGRLFSELSPPLTIGREEDNDVQLNDERISRFHAKIQADSDRIILTDLDSTNGTRVNGHPVKMRVLRIGDLISIGRCVLVVGSPDDLKGIRSAVEEPATDDALTDPPQPHEEPMIELGMAFPGGPPPVPTQLTALQTAELSDLLEYVRTEILNVLCRATDSDGESVQIPRQVWHRLEALGPQLSRYLTHISSPVEE